MREKSLHSFDQTRIVYRVGGKSEGRWLVIANGYGGTFCAFDDLFSRLADRYRLLIWDYRGLHRSAVPSDRSKLRIEDHCRDLDLLCEAEGIERMILGGWSVGVQVVLEQYRRRPESIDALLLINGAHGRVLQRSLGNALAKKVAKKLLPAGLRSARFGAPLLQRTLLPMMQQVAAWKFAPRLMRVTGIFNGESQAMQQAAHAVLGLDYDVYLKMILLADEHDADDLLATITVPTLVIGADRDTITSAPLTQGMAKAIPGAHYYEQRGATHYGVMEFPDAYAQRINAFVDASLSF